MQVPPYPAIEGVGYPSGSLGEPREPLPVGLYSGPRLPEGATEVNFYLEVDFYLVGWSLSIASML